MRMRTRWHNKNKQRSLNETGSVLGFLFWQISIDRLKSLREANIRVFAPQESIHLLSELVIFLIHNADRHIHKICTDDKRQELLQSIAISVAQNYASNAADAVGESSHHDLFIHKLNQRLVNYSSISGENDGLRFSLTVALGKYVENIVTENDKPWVTQQLIEIEIPELFRKLDHSLNSLLADLNSKTNDDEIKTATL